jgi:hypothetical protein
MTDRVVPLQGRGVDPEKLPDTPVRMVIVRGVTITSRYRKQREFAVMSQVVAALPPWAVRVMQAMWCDSKASCCYSVAIDPDCDRPEITRSLARLLDQRFVALDGGHNGIDVGTSLFGGDTSAWADPNWQEDWLPEA